MRYKLLGRTGLRVSELCLGTMTFGPDWGWGADRDESKAMFDAFAEAGGNFVDTANRYTNGTAEAYVGEFIASERGLGYLMIQVQASLDTPAMFMAVVLLTLLGIALYLIVMVMEHLWVPKDARMK